MPRTPKPHRRLLAVSVIAAALLATTVTAPSAEAAPPHWPRPAWNEMWSWAMNTGAFSSNGIAQVRGSSRDMVVIGRYNTYNGREWTRDEIEAGKLSKWLLAYMAVGEAQRTEWYWRPEWNRTPPAWVIGQNPYWSNNVFAELWNGDWQMLLRHTIDRIIDQGFDGAFLDVADAYWFPGYPDGPTWYNKWEAALTICALADHARARKPDFKLVVNNALDLFWMVPNYMRCIDGTVIEQLWWLAPDRARDRFYTDQKIGELRYHQAAGKPIFSIDYAPWWALPDLDRRARALGYLPYATNGTDMPLPD
jgi:cysteinyl-tRNA synthetase, unknown class